MKTPKYYVYVLVHPDNDCIFYVGKGTVQKYKHLPERMGMHETEARQGFKSAKHNTIRSIWAKGLEVQKYKVFEIDNEEEALLYEQALIRLMNGEGKLTNIPLDISNIAFGVGRNYMPLNHRSNDDLPSQVSQSKLEQNRAVNGAMNEQLGIAEAARELGVNERTVRRWIKSGELNSTRDIVGRYKIARADLEEFRRRRMER